MKVGLHKLTCAGIEDPAVERMLEGERVDILYCDPPWGNTRYWATINKKMTGRYNEPISHEALLNRIFELADRFVSGHVFLETGKRWGDQVAELMGDHCAGVSTFPMLYKAGGRTLGSILVHGVNGPAPPFTFDPTGRHGYQVVRDIIANVATPGGIVLDPCCGTGFTALAAIEAGMAFRGNEVNAKRIATTRALLS